MMILEIDKVKSVIENYREEVEAVNQKLIDIDQ